MFGIVAAVASRLLRLSPIVGYIGLGVALSATGLDRLMGSASIETLAELGVVFLLFDVGLHFSFNHVKAQAKDIFAFGPVQVVLGAVGLGALGLAWGLPLGAALLVGATLALSSTAVVAGLIAERHQQNCPVGLTGTAILIFQDLAAILILIVATALGTGQALLPAIGLALVKAVGAFAVAMLLARLAVRPLFGLIARTRNEEVFTAIALLVALSTAWATGRIGLSLTLGAFLGGMILADTPYTAVIKSEIRPFRGLLLGFFFISVGVSLDRAVLFEHWIAVIAVTLLLFGAKMLLNAGASLVFRWSVPGSAQLGFLLAQGSEFAFVILSIGSVRALIGQRECSVLVAAVALSLAATPTVADAGRQLAGRAAPAETFIHGSRADPARDARPRGDRGNGAARPDGGRRLDRVRHRLRGRGTRRAPPSGGGGRRLSGHVRRRGRHPAVVDRRHERPADQRIDGADAGSFDAGQHHRQNALSGSTAFRRRGGYRDGGWHLPRSA